MPQNIVGLSTWTDPVVMPADTDPADLIFVKEAVQGLADRDQFLLDLFTPPVVSRTWAAIPSAAWVDTPGDWTFNGSTQKWTSATDSTRLCYPLPKLPAGATIQSIVANLVPGAARATSGNRIKVNLRYHTRLAGDAFVGSSVRDDGGATLQDVTQSGIATVIDDAYFYYVEITGGNTGSTAADVINGVAVTFDDPSPRIFP